MVSEKIKEKCLNEFLFNQTRINDTDKDSRLMMMKRKDWGNGYNPQNTTEKQFIISTTVPNSANHTNDTENDTYEDTEGNLFKCKQFVGSVTGRSRGRPKKDEILKEEDFEAKLYFTTGEDGKKKYLQIAQNLKNIFKENDDRLYGEEGKKIYKKRSGCLENVFGNIKINLKFERFNLMGFQGIQIEWNLISLAHNLGKIMKFKAI